MAIVSLFVLIITLFSACALSAFAARSAHAARLLQVRTGVSAKKKKAAKLAIILLESEKVSLGRSFAEVQNDFVPIVNNWYNTVSYGNFAWTTVEMTGPLKVSDDATTCRGRGPDNKEHLFEVAKNTVEQGGVPFNEAEYKSIVVIYPKGWCSTEVGFTEGNWVALPDALTPTTAAPSPPTAEAYYSSLQELGHTLFGSAHADSLTCDTVFSEQCLSEALNKPGGDPYPCFQDGGRPAGSVICQYGDPFDPMGSDTPGQLHPTGFYSVPPYEWGEPWPNGVEMDKAGWLGDHKEKVSVKKGSSQVFELSPIEEQAPSHKQFLFIEPMRQMKQWLEIEYRNPPSGTSRWEDGYLSPEWSGITGGILLHLASGLNGKSQSALLAASQSFDNSQCPPDSAYFTTFCEFYDAALPPGGTFEAAGDDYQVRLLSVGTLGSSSATATVEVSRCPCAGLTYVTNFGANSITEYAKGANGDVTPTATISGANTGLSQPTGLALDSLGAIYVTNINNNSVTEYAGGASGDVTPTATISGTNTGLGRPESVAVDATGTLYVANDRRLSRSV